jgi:DNA-binding HxlR family transcriptional regulator
MSALELGDRGRFLEHHREAMAGVLECVDRLLVRGTLPDCCHPGAMIGQLLREQRSLAGYGSMVEGIGQEIRTQAQRLAKAAGLSIEYLARADAFRKEERVAQILRERGDAPGLVHIFSGLERCSTFKAHNSANGLLQLFWSSGKCLHYYFYFVDEELGLCFLRVQTWAPYTVDFYCNGHSWLARQLSKAGLAFTTYDNSFVQIADWARANELAGQFDGELLHRRLEKITAWLLPSLQRHFPRGWHWSIAQMEYSLDLVFQDRARLQGLAQGLVETAIHAIHADDVARFLGRRAVSPHFEGEVCGRLETRIEGTRLRHRFGPVSLKMYDKAGLILRLETTCNNPTFFYHQRLVKHPDGTSETKLAPVRKTIHSLTLLCERLRDGNHRYLDFLSQLESPGDGPHKLEQISAPVRDQAGRSSRGFNLFASLDLRVILTLLRGEHRLDNVLSNRSLRAHLPDLSSGQISRVLKRLQLHGLIYRTQRRYRYLLTSLGSRLLVAALKLRAFLVLPAMHQNTAPA